MATTEVPRFLFSVRFMIAITAFCGYAVQYIQRIDMSVAIVCMINNTAVTEMIQQAQKLKLNESSSSSTSLLEMSNETLSSKISSKCLFQKADGIDGGANSNELNGEYVWNKEIQGLILSAYFYGYLTTQVIGGFFSMRFGAKIVLALAILVGSLLTLLLPVAAQYGDYQALIACRLLIGVAHGSFWPAMSTLWSRWAPPGERSRLVAIGNAGAQIGNVVALPLGGFLCVNGFAGGWPSLFYVFGGLGIVWFVFWMILVSKSPETHSFIGEKERKYVIAQTRAGLSGQKMPFLQSLKCIYTCKAFYGVMCAHTCSNFGVYLFLTQLPTYMREILKFDIKSNGVISALPYVFFWLLTLISSVIGDKLIQSGKMSKSQVRILFNGLGKLVPMVAIVGLSFVTCAEPYVGVALLIVGLAFTGCAYGAGFMVNYNDIAGSYAGLCFGLANTVATVPGILAPWMVGVLTKNQKQEEWQLVFFITAAVYLVGAVGFAVLASGETQPWATKKPTSSDINEAEESVPLK